MISHYYVSVALIMNVEPRFAFNSEQNRKCIHQVFEKIGNSDSLKRIQTPVVQLQDDDGLIFTNNTSCPSYNLFLKSLDIDLNKINSRYIGVSKYIIQPFDDHPFR